MQEQLGQALIFCFVYGLDLIVVSVHCIVTETLECPQLSYITTRILGHYRSPQSSSCGGLEVAFWAPSNIFLPHPNKLFWQLFLIFNDSICIQ